MNEMQPLGSWTQSRPTLVVMGFTALASVAADLLEWVIRQSPPQPWFASVPYLYVPLAAWLLYSARLDPFLLRVIKASFAGALLLLALGPEWQASIPVWVAVRVFNLVAGVGMLLGAWPTASWLERSVGILAAVAMLAWSLMPPGPRLPLAYVILGAMLYGVIASTSLRKKHLAALQDDPTRRRPPAPDPS